MEKLLILRIRSYIESENEKVVNITKKASSINAITLIFEDKLTRVVCA